MSDPTVETPEAAAARLLNAVFKPSHILVALSGGGDSVGLLVALAEAIRAGGHAHSLSAATVDHDLRSGSAQEALDVAAFCARLEIPHQSRRWRGDKPHTGLMAAAREARYELLAEMALAAGADFVVTGHTFDDQQETLAMRDARRVSDGGSPLRGIADAMLFDRRIWIVRPFLQCRREAIRAFLVARGVSWIDDPSNENAKFERVRVRNRLQHEGTPRLIDDAPASTKLSLLAGAWLDAHVRIHAGLICEIDRAALADEPDVLTYGLGHLAAVMGGQAFAPGREVLGRITDFLARGEAGRRTAGGVVFDLRRNSLYLARESRNIGCLLLAAGESGIWDGRFDVANDGNVAVRIHADDGSDMLSLPADIPNGVIQRARSVAPIASFETGNGQACPDRVLLSPRFAPFDRFLTRFDYTFAVRLAAVFERTPYLLPPL